MHTQYTHDFWGAWISIFSLINAELHFLLGFQLQRVSKPREPIETRAAPLSSLLFPLGIENTCCLDA